jgi:predicted TIM-barrel fold metal-dependent hydrolase
VADEPYRLVDVDNHYYEPDDCFTRHLDPAFADRAFHIERDPDGLGRPYFGATPAYYLVSNPADLIGRPGVVREHKDERYRPLDAADLVRPGDVPEVARRDSRLAWMDAHGIEAVVMWPSLGLTVEVQMRDDPAACVANLRSFNRWLDEEWGFDYRHRIFAVPWMTLIDLDEAVAELEHVLDRGARVVHLLFAPVNDRSIGDPYFDPFWARLEEAGVPVAFHGAESGYNQLLSVRWGEAPRPPAHAQSAFQRACFFGERPIMDTLASLVLHNVFGRFPRLRAMSVENGSWWVPFLLRTMDRAEITGAQGPWLGGRIEDRPSEIFGRHVWVAPFDDDDVRSLVDLIGPLQVLLGSDYPHPEGHPDPRRFFNDAGLTDEELRLVTRDNAAALLGLS